MAWYRVQYEIGGIDHGIAVMPSIYLKGLQTVPMNRVWLCRECGEVWAKRTNLDHPHDYRGAATSLCNHHGFGTLFSDYEDDAYVKYAPTEVLRYELERIHELLASGAKPHDYMRNHYGTPRN